MFISKSPEETRDLGIRWGEEARAGWVFALDGDLGSGKTQLVKGLALGLGISARVHSPTFSLLNCYEGGRLPLFHLDLYRLESRAQIMAAGLEEYLGGRDGVTVVEWAARWFGNQTVVTPLPSGDRPRLRRVQLETIDPTTRRITHEDIGA